VATILMIFFHENQLNKIV